MFYDSDYINMNPDQQNPPSMINENMSTYLLYENRLIKIPTGLQIYPSQVHLWDYSEWTPSKWCWYSRKIIPHFPKVHLWDFKQHPYLCTSCWLPVIQQNSPTTVKLEQTTTGTVKLTQINR